MPVVPTYPGVYIEEIPSGVHTITGVSTSIAAFVGYTEQGPVDEPVHIFSYADFERAFGGLTLDSPLSYAVNQFFENGGSEGYVVRVANGATSARLVLTAVDATATPMIDITAATDGVWGNFVQIDIDYNTTNPDSYFNLKATEYTIQNGQMVPTVVETFRNLSMSPMNPNYFIPTINGTSQLITVDLDGPIKASPATYFTGSGSSQSGVLTLPISITASNNTFSVSVDGGAPQQLTLPVGNLTTPNDVKVALLSNSALGALSSIPHVATTANGVLVQSATPGQSSAIQFTNTNPGDASTLLKLGVANGGIEIEGAAMARPLLNGNLGGALPANLGALVAGGTIGIDLYQANSTSAKNSPSPLPVKLWGATKPANVNDLVSAMNTAFATATDPNLVGTKVELDTLNGSMRLRIVPGSSQPNMFFKITDPGDGTANTLNLITPASPPPKTLTPPPPDSITSFGHYVLGSGSGDPNVPWVSSAAPGNNGGVPQSASDYGDPLKKTGFYSLDTIDIFNILCFPDVADKTFSSNLYTDALEYCTLHRAMLIVDLPSTTTTISGAQGWMSGTGATILDSHVAAYFPHMLDADPLQNGNVHQFPNCGAIAGIWARTDAQRGVWKAPAGTQANILGATGTAYRMNNQENGVLNPLGLNCIRTFPIFGTVVWGARTMRGADQLADDYKYVPVRRLALFLEESLYRGTQWVVFEPNDEPLWSQIRLNVGAFMHSLFAQGAFAGQTPKDAYFVKCDDETTTPLDQDLGRVNIIVGFAPLRPAEFVIIQIQQIVSVGPT